MHQRLTILVITAVLAAGGICSHAQVVQLPSVRNFSYSGGAWVPDGGTVSLAGNTGAQYGSTSRGWGPYSPRSAGGSLSASSLTASVTIIDLQALDEAILSQTVTTSADPADVSAGRLLGNSRRLINASERYYGDSGVRPIDPNGYAKARQGHAAGIQRASAESQIESDIRYYLQEGQKAERANRLISARVYYRMAIEAMTPEIKERYQRIAAEKAQQRLAIAEEKAKKNRPDRIKF